ncbi:hypothetical protein RHGRI_030434 [Rhododendron griersonianum]|uniref:Uncharacterized protein n=1 Tax=Rhododendron griersonianum TaxID=479676 RepID=A0AAV6IMX7_9ERIC|nr:hypothetical protein RHGRI_030434 [Rhododendron griersonianum]
MAGAVLSALNTRLDPPMLALLLQQLEAKIIFVDYQYVQIVLKALEAISAAKAKSPFLVVIGDSDPGDFSTTQEVPPRNLDYDSLLEMGKLDFEIVNPIDECDPITVTHLCGAPTILNMIAEAPFAGHRPLPTKVDLVIAGALPPIEILDKVHKLGFNVSHAYGMTEALCPVIVRSLEFDQYDCASIKDRNGVHNVVMEGVDVKDPTTMRSVPADWKTIGEVMLRSNTLMLGYLKNVRGTQAAFKNGWYGTRDLGVRDPNGHIRIKDRAVDAIFNYEGDAISTLEIEAVLASHPAIEATAVVGRPDDRLGERPCAFVKLKEGRTTSSQDIIEFCGVRLPNYMVPGSVVFGDLPVNSTGKIQKCV